MALAQFEGTLVLVSHDRHLLRATTEQFMIVAGGKVQEFDGDLDDYRDWLFKTKLAKADAPAALPAKAVEATKPAPKAETPKATTVPPAQRQEQKRAEAAERARRAALAKPVETRIKRLEEQMAKANAKKKLVDARLAEPSIYEDAKKEELKTLMLDQAYLVRELDQAEGEWLEQQAELEKITAEAAASS